MYFQIGLFSRILQEKTMTLSSWPTLECVPGSGIVTAFSKDFFRSNGGRLRQNIGIEGEKLLDMRIGAFQELVDGPEEACGA